MPLRRAITHNIRLAEMVPVCHTTIKSNRQNSRKRANTPFFSFLATFFQENGKSDGLNNLKLGMNAGVRSAQRR